MTETKDFWLGDRFVRPSLGEIQLGLDRVHLEPRSMEVLLALVRRPGEVLSKQQLIDAVWGDAFVSDEVLTHAIWDLRRALGDQASDPEFIQTIPKRGYRLIAPVKPVERPRRRATDRLPESQAERGRAGGRRLFWGLVLGLAGVALLLWLGIRVGAKRAELAATGPRAARTLLLAVGRPDGPEPWKTRLQGSLGGGLAGSEIEVLPVDSCEDAAEPEAGYCLEAELQYLGDRYNVSAQLFERPEDVLEYTTSAPVDLSGANLEAAAQELGEKVRTYFQVIDDPFFEDPDMAPWFSLQEHDVRAVRDFLHGMAYVYRNEIGGRHALASAVALDPDFVAPRIFRTPSLVGEVDADALAEHRAAFDRLYPSADAFEKAMIQWARALMDGDRAKQIRHLEVALESVPRNRQIEYVLGFTYAESGNLDEAWRLIEPLLGQNWRFPGLYSTAAQLAVQRDKIKDIRTALELAQNVKPVDPEVLAVSIALAIYDEDPESEERLRLRLEQRRRDLAEDEGLYGFTVPAVSRALAGRAAAEGRAAIADRLRESAD